MNALPPSRRFRMEREAEWLRLEEILHTAERRSVEALDDEDLIALPTLYRGALSSLSVARETSLDRALVEYLEALCARAYFFVYGVRTPPGRRAAAFFARDWPAAGAALWRETLVAVLLLVLGAAAGFLLVTADPTWFDAFVPGELAAGRDFTASRETLLATLYHEGGAGGLGAFATFLFTHNSQVAILCFALGFAFGVPTVLLLVHNGTMLGAMLALFASRGLTGELSGWLLIHGSTEMFAIALAGAAGLRIGWSSVFPGSRSRLAAMTQAGRIAAVAMAGVVLMLFVAGLLEGYGRELILDDTARYSIGAAMLLFWLLYFYAPRRSADG